jgi:hypothetical protein
MNSYRSVPHLRWAIVPVLMTIAAFAQMSPQPEGFQRQIQEMQKAAVANAQQLHRYQWTESTTLSVNGDQKPAKKSLCHYGPDGTLQKTPLGPPQQPPKASGGPIRKMIAEKKIEEFQRETAEIHSVAGIYLPLNSASLKEALHTRRVDFEKEGGDDNAIVIHDYAKPGDELRLVLDVATMHLQRIVVKTYLDKPENILTASVDFSSLQDGTSYPSVTTINAPSKKISIITLNSNFSLSAYQDNPH